MGAPSPSLPPPAPLPPPPVAEEDPRIEEAKAKEVTRLAKRSTQQKLVKTRSTKEGELVGAEGTELFKTQLGA